MWHPTALLQMLQLWVPRTPQLESALFRSIRPLLPYDFDVESDASQGGKNGSVPSRRFDNVDDLDEKTIAGHFW